MAFAKCVRGAAVLHQPSARASRNCRARIGVIRCDGSRSDDDIEFPRRSALLGMLGILSLASTNTAQAATDYYQDLLSKSKRPDTSTLLKAYEKTKKISEPKQMKKKAQKTPATGRPATLSTKQAKVSKAAATSGATFNPIEVGLGLLGIAGAIAVGQSSGKDKKEKKASKATVKRSAPPPKTTVVKPAPTKPPGTQRKSTVRATPGTVRLSPGKSGAGSKTKKVMANTQVKRTLGEPSGKKGPSDTGIGGLVGVGVVVLAGLGLLLGGNPSATKAPEAKKPVAEIKQEIQAPAPAPAPPVASVPEPTKAPVPAASVTKESPKQEKLVDPTPTEEKKTNRVPTPTTGNSPLVLVGGGIATLIVAAAALGGSDGSSNNTSVQREDGSKPAEDDAKARAAEARAWIEAWRAKQGK